VETLFELLLAAKDCTIDRESFEKTLLLARARAGIDPRFEMYLIYRNELDGHKT